MRVRPRHSSPRLLLVRRHHQTLRPPWRGHTMGWTCKRRKSPVLGTSPDPRHTRGPTVRTHSRSVRPSVAIKRFIAVPGCELPAAAHAEGGAERRSASHGQPCPGPHSDTSRNRGIQTDGQTQCTDADVSIERTVSIVRAPVHTESELGRPTWPPSSP